VLKFIFTVIIVLPAWLLFTLSFNVQEVIAGIVSSIFVAFVTRDLLFYGSPLKLLCPRRWIVCLRYGLVFLLHEIKSHLKVCSLVITGKINPAIVKLRTDTKTDTGKTLLANSITLTPGTLTIKADKNLYVHYISFDKKNKDFVARPFEKLVVMLE
jgi:multicomponent Na+:H+ antiporter subunit E